MDEYFEVEIIDKQGNKHYEIASCRTDCYQFMKLHNGVSLKAVNKGEKYDSDF